MKKIDLISVKEILEKKVIDSKGTLVGVIIDIKLSLAGQIKVLIETKAVDLIEITFSDISSIKDFVLLKESAKIVSRGRSQSKKKEKIETRILERKKGSTKTVVCDKCGTEAPGHAKFCPKCGSKIKSIML